MQRGDEAAREQARKDAVQLAMGVAAVGGLAAAAYNDADEEAKEGAKGGAMVGAAVAGGLLMCTPIGWLGAAAVVGGGALWGAATASGQQSDKAADSGNYRAGSHLVPQRSPSPDGRIFSESSDAYEAGYSDNHRQKSYSKCQGDGAMQVGWNKRITDLNVNRAMEDMLKEHPDKKIIIATGGHGDKGRGFKERDAERLRDGSFYTQDQQSVNQMKEVYPDRQISLRSYADANEYAKYKEEMRDPHNIGIRAECYGAQNGYYPGQNGARQSSDWMSSD